MSKEFKDTLVDAINLTTGQQKLIEEYRSLSGRLRQMINEEKDTERREQLSRQIDRITEYSLTSIYNSLGEKLTYDETKVFSPKKLFQKKKLLSKIDEFKSIENAYKRDEEEVKK